MQLNPYLSFKGQCEEAFKFYQQCFGGNIQMMTWGASPMADQVPSEWHDKIIHVSLTVGDTALLGADTPPDHYEKPAGFSITIQINDPAEAERIFHALAEAGTVRMSTLVSVRRYSAASGSVSGPKAVPILRIGRETSAARRSRQALADNRSVSALTSTRLPAGWPERRQWIDMVPGPAFTRTT